MEAQDIKKAIKEIVRHHAPEAEVILYGSRARGDAQPDSDWDVLILFPEKPDKSKELAIRRALYTFEWEIDEIITVMCRSKLNWHSPRMRITPFYQTVTREGVAL